MSSSEPSPATARWRLDLAYDGEGFHGFAEQPGLLTIGGSLRAAIARALHLPTPPPVTVAGRTDAGVHATAQVVHVDLPDPLYAHGDDPAQLARSVNGQLGGRIVVTATRRVGGEFDARRSAEWRAYRYLVAEVDGPPLAGLAKFSWVVSAPLDAEALAAASALIVGQHDFRSFCRRPAGRRDAPLVRDVTAAVWTRHPDALMLGGPATTFWRFDIRANAFCHQMVRALTGGVVAVARGRLGVGEFAERLRTPRRDGLPAPAPAAGLALVGVGYPEVVGGPSGPVTLRVPRGRTDVVTA